MLEVQASGKGVALDILIQLAGVTLVIAAFVDIYFTVLQGGSVSLLSTRLSKGVWWAFRSVGKRMNTKRNRLLSYAGPTLIPAIVLLWVSLLSIGFALFYLPVLGESIVASSGETPTGFWPALYFSQTSLVTLGTGDLVANSNFYRLSDTFVAIAGFCIVTSSLTYLLSVYNSLIRHNTFAMALHHASDDTGDAAELIARFGAGGSFQSSESAISALANELISINESHHIYVVLRYFRGSNPAYSLPRVAMLVLNSTSLIRSALDQDHFAGLTRSATASQLWRGGMRLLEDLESDFVPEDRVDIHEDRPQPEDEWRRHYRQAVARLQKEGIRTAVDPSAGEDHYVDLRRTWQPHISAFADYLLYTEEEVAGERR